MSAPEGKEVLVGRCYTRARRSPVVVGVVPGGGGRGLRLVGGPYTVTQLGAMVVSVVVLVVLRPVWGGHGLVDLVVLVGVPFGAAFALRHLHVDGRNPAAAAASVVMMLAAPRAGRLRGRPLRPVRSSSSGALATLGAGPRLGPAEDPRSGGLPAVGRTGSAGPAVPVEAPVASGVQALLARRTSLGD
ncbi:hypothetical protein P3T27_007676 [Kitasatospora sp. MAA19]|uniref:hypothetical protein n=1 Tax=unclassified Kitasatospora TaxID=2633591 RepID=UPI0024759355|nr:hypothetical protein [Kitasatospora sp. MAA19]MDH6710925.1 hypothetical protein [Kitasatospora sp. MAA19]